MSTRARTGAATASAQVIPAEPSPLAVVEALQAAVEQGRISPKLGREMLVRLVPPKKPTAQVDLPASFDEILQTAKFHTIWPIVATREEALAAVGAAG